MASLFCQSPQASNQQGFNAAGTQMTPSAASPFNIPSTASFQTQPTTVAVPSTQPQQWLFGFPVPPPTPTSNAAIAATSAPARPQTSFGGGSIFQAPSTNPFVAQNPFGFTSTTTSTAAGSFTFGGNPGSTFVFTSPTIDPTPNKTPFGFTTITPSSTPYIPVNNPVVQQCVFSFGIPASPIPTAPSIHLEEVNATAETPVPPNWDFSYDAATRASTMYIKLKVQPFSNEYKTLAELVHSAPSLQVTGIQRVVNCKLWKKFLIAREELLSLQSGDAKLLTDLGLSDSDAQQRADEFSNFNSVQGIPGFADNMALLFHCTRMNLDSILRKGLDDRLAKGSGLLGKGIYFTDNPVKAVQYDQNNVLILFAVLLGDCTQHIARKTLLCEPEKADCQKRSKDDESFNSIVGRPITSDNEYVIYDRRQCIPLYLIHYTKTLKPASQSAHAQMYAEARTKFPPFSWIERSQATTNSSYVLLPNDSKRWPFFAQTIFNFMAEPETGTTDSQLNSVEKVLARLREMGFPDHNLNAQKLAENNFDIDQTAEALSTLSASPAPAAAQVPTPTTSNSTAECPICRDDEVTNWTSFPCSHKVCSDCYNKLKKQGTTMTGQAHTFVKCPLCNRVDGIEIGTCPDGVMSPNCSHATLPGHEGHTSIEIAYSVNCGSFQTHRKAFLPDSPIGRRALNLLKIAWDRRLVFSIGTSMTTGQSNTLVWNIHHKAGITGGVQAHAYPDPTYLDRLFDELKQYGIQ